MKDNVLEKYAKPLSDRRSLPAGDDDGLDNLGSFGWLRGTSERAVMLELRAKDGHVTALAYHWLERAEFDPSDGMTLVFMGKTVRLRGRNLNAELRPNVRLFTGIVRHRVPWIQEADEPMALQAPAQATIIDEIRFNP